ncbi:hypothetical protein, partial [Burkholderia pseudomallei]|uniref:hypothetical protein n=3 Tax=Burkholderia pseudomallei TaxID=28450 RepID=UPI00195928A4
MRAVVACDALGGAERRAIRQYAIRDTRYAAMSRERDAIEGSPKCRAGLGKPDVNRAGASESMGFVESVGSCEPR